MGAASVRPPIADLVFEVHGQPLHPEFFDIRAVRQVHHADFLLTVRITRTGHVIHWQNRDVLLAELTTAVDEELPHRRRLLRHRLGGERSASLACGHGVHYQATFHKETLPSALFAQVHDEIVADGSKRGMLYHRGSAGALPSPHHRFPRGPAGASPSPPASLVLAEFRPGCLFLTTFHTFPSENTVVKTQSLIEKRPG